MLLLVGSSISAEQSFDSLGRTAASRANLTQCFAVLAFGEVENWKGGAWKACNSEDNNAVGGLQEVDMRGPDFW